MKELENKIRESLPRLKEVDHFFGDGVLLIEEHPIKLNDVLEWHSKDGRDKYSHFEVSKGEAYFSIYDGEEVESIVWNLSSVFLADQSDELKEFLNGL